ncbi:MAG: bifunctional hydroxymethylpyrimidine kinase/phosphomethylpyrimidine kinase [Acidobacteriota bacterium]|nr:bifunctional hydroxymethylpyrimidine kinase/phosphomethylpyrimidine kinase [Acidobacteriota bacterium]
MIDGWPTALTVAGSDSWGGAGLQADLRTFAALGVWGTAAVTAVTAQNHRGVLAAHLMDPGLVAAQIEAVAESEVIGAVKTGMLGDSRVIESVAGVIERLGLGPLVVDPVQAASQGGQLLDPAALPVLIERLLPLSALVTPNLPEAEALLGARIKTRDEMVDAAAALGALGPPAVLLKGGHLEGPESPDLLWTGRSVVWLEGRRVDAVHSHGTGCTLSAAVAAALARGEGLEAACRQGKDYVTLALNALVKGDK